MSSLQTRDNTKQLNKSPTTDILRYITAISEPWSNVLGVVNWKVLRINKMTSTADHKSMYVNLLPHKKPHLARLFCAHSYTQYLLLGRLRSLRASDPQLSPRALSTIYLHPFRATEDLRSHVPMAGGALGCSVCCMRIGILPVPTALCDVADP